MASFFRSVVPATATHINGSGDKNGQDDPAQRTPPRGPSPVPPARSPARPMTPRRRMLQQQQQQQQRLQQSQSQSQQPPPMPQHAQPQPPHQHPSQPPSRTPTKNQTKRRQIAETRLQNAIRTHERAQAEVDRLCDLLERAAAALKRAREDARAAQLELDEAARLVNLEEGGGKREMEMGMGLQVHVPVHRDPVNNGGDNGTVAASPGSLAASAAARMKNSRRNPPTRGKKTLPSLELGDGARDDSGEDDIVTSHRSHANHSYSSAGRSTILDSARRRMKEGERQLFQTSRGNEEDGLAHGRGKDPDEYDTEDEDEPEHDDEDEEEQEEEEEDSSEDTESSDDESSGTEEEDDEKYEEFNDHNEDEDGFEIGNEALEQIRYRLELANIEPNSPEGTKLLDDLLIRLQATRETVVDVPMVNGMIDELLEVDSKGLSSSSGYVSLSTLNATQPEMQTQQQQQQPTQQPPRIRICRNGKVLGWYEGQLDEDGTSRHGSGSMYYDAGHESHGTWHKDEMTGRGIYKWSDGHVYDGEWANGKRHGLGRFIRPDGVILYGTYEKGHHRGQGVRWSADRKEAQIVVDGVPKKNVSLENAEEIARKMGFEDVPPSL